MTSIVPRLLLALALLGAGLTLGALGAAPATASTTAADLGSLSVSYRGGTDITDPVLASTDPKVPITLTVDVFADQGAHDVQVSASGAGLDVTPATVDLGTLGNAGLRSVRFTVRATTAGLHRLTVTATASDQESGTLRFEHVFAPGGTTHIPARRSLAFLGGIAWQGPSELYQPSVRATRQLTFVDARHAYLGLTRGGVPRCHDEADRWRATSGCVRYAFDPSTRLVQIGGLIGDLEGARGQGYLFLSGFVPGNHVEDDQYPYATLGFSKGERLDFLHRGTRLAGTYRFHDHQRKHAGLTTARLVLTRSGHYRLRTIDTVAGTRSSCGHYRLAGPGRLVLTHGGHREVHTLALRHDANGDPQLWLTVPGTGPRRPLDGAVLNRRH